MTVAASTGRVCNASHVPVSRSRARLRLPSMIVLIITMTPDRPGRKAQSARACGLCSRSIRSAGPPVGARARQKPASRRAVATSVNAGSVASTITRTGGGGAKLLSRAFDGGSSIPMSARPSATAAAAQPGGSAAPSQPGSSRDADSLGDACRQRRVVPGDHHRDDPGLRPYRGTEQRDLQRRDDKQQRERDPRAQQPQPPRPARLPGRFATRSSAERQNGGLQRPRPARIDEVRNA